MRRVCLTSKPCWTSSAVDIIQPSVAKIGGVTEVMKIAAVAETQGVRLVPHCAYFGPGFLASLHLAASLWRRPRPSNDCSSIWKQVLITILFDVKDGRVAVPDGPGLGRDPDLDILRRYALSPPTVLRA